MMSSFSFGLFAVVDGMGLANSLLSTRFRSFVDGVVQQPERWRPAWSIAPLPSRKRLSVCLQEKPSSSLTIGSTLWAKRKGEPTLILMDKNRYYIEPCARKSDRKTPNARQQVLPNRYGAGFSDTPPREDFAIRKYLKKFFFSFPFFLFASSLKLRKLRWPIVRTNHSLTSS